MSSDRKDDKTDRRLKKAFKITLAANILFWIAVLFIQCGNCTGKPSKSSKKTKKQHLEYVQLLYNNKVNVECRVPRCEFAMEAGHRFTMSGIKLKGKKGVVPVGAKPKKAKKRVSIMLKGDGVSFRHTKTITIEDISRAESPHFTFKTPYGRVKAIIWVKEEKAIEELPAVQTEVAEDDQENYDEIKADLCGYAGRSTHLLIDGSGSMMQYIVHLWPIIEQVLKDCSIRLSGLSWYSNRGDVRHSPHTSQQALSVAVKRGRSSHNSNRYVAEAPSPALESVAGTFRPGLIILISDEGAEVGGTKPNTNGIPVYAIAIGRWNNCSVDLGAIAEFTGGKMKYIDPLRDLGINLWR